MDVSFFMRWVLYLCMFILSSHQLLIHLLLEGSFCSLKHVSSCFSTGWYGEFDGNFVFIGASHLFNGFGHVVVWRIGWRIGAFSCYQLRSFGVVGFSYAFSFVVGFNIAYQDNVDLSCLLLHTGWRELYLPIDLGLKFLEQLFKGFKEFFFHWRVLDLCIRMQFYIK